MSNDYDLLVVLCELVGTILITIVGECVKGYYSGKNHSIQHDMNQWADELATII
jgi:hypothetical protein